MQEQKYSIREWAKDDRPREKLLKRGARSLSDSELLAILLQKGTHRLSALDLGREVLRMGQNNLFELGKFSAIDYMKIKGIGEAKAITLVAAMEIGRRRQEAGPIYKRTISSSKDMAGYLQHYLQDYRHEVFVTVFLNRAQKVKSVVVVSEGGLTSTVVDIRIILKKALEEDAVSLILCHNHPSGSLKPSRADEALTEKMKAAAGYFDIRIMDHIIVSEEGYFSFAEQGLI